MKKISKILFFSILTIFLMVGSSWAIPNLSLDDGAGNTISIDDNTAGDLDSTVGAITWLGVLGVWDINVSTGLTKPVLGSATLPNMDLNSINHSTTGGTMTISFYDDLFIAPGGLLSLQLNAGGTTAGSVTFTTTSSGTMGDINNLAFTSPGAFAGTDYGTFTPITPYDLTLTALISHPGAGTTSFDAELLVPEPATMLLLGSGLIGLAGLGRKKFAKKS